MLVTKVTLESGEDFMICTKWDDENKELEILSNEKSYKGSISNDVLQENAENLGVNPEIFNEDIRKALDFPICEDFIYSIEDETFEIRKKELLCGVEGETIYVSISLQEIQVNPISVLAINHLLEEKSCLNQELESKTIPIEAIKKDQELLMESIEKLTKEKHEIESNFCEKFVAILNTKKRKIQELKDKIMDLERNVPSTSGAGPRFANNRFAVELPSSSSLDLNYSAGSLSLELSNKSAEEDFSIIETRNRDKSPVKSKNRILDDSLEIVQESLKTPEKKKPVAKDNKFLPATWILEKKKQTPKKTPSPAADSDSDASTCSLDLSKAGLDESILKNQQKTPKGSKIAEKRKFTPDKGILEEITKSPSTRKSARGLFPSSKRTRSEKNEVQPIDSSEELFSNIETIVEEDEIPSSQPETCSESIYGTSRLRRANTRRSTPSPPSQKPHRLSEKNAFDFDTEDMFGGQSFTAFLDKNSD